MYILRQAIKTLILLLSLWPLSAHATFDLFFSVDDNTPGIAQEITFTLTASGHTDVDGPEMYIDYEHYPPADPTKRGDWIPECNMVAHASSLNDADDTWSPAYTFPEYGRYRVRACVVDDADAVEISIIFIDVDISTTKDPTSDCGANNWVSGGEDNGGRLDACIDGLGAATRFEVPTGTYYFTSTDIISQDTQIVPASGKYGDVIFIFNPTSSGDQLFAAAAQLNIQNIRFETTVSNLKPMVFTTNTNVHVDNCTFDSFTKLIDSSNLPGSSFKRINFINWAANDPIPGGGNEFTAGRFMVKDSYVEGTSTGTAQFNYAGAFFTYNTYYSVYGTDGATFSRYTNALTDGNAFIYHNVFTQTSNDVNYSGWNWTQADLNIEIKDNVFDTPSQTRIAAGSGGSGTIIIDGNKFTGSPIGTVRLINIGGDDATMQITTNVFGEGLSDNFWNFSGARCSPGSGGDADCDATAVNTADPSFVDCDCNGDVDFTTGGVNTSDATDYSIADPGALEFALPVVCYVGINGNTVSLDAIDTGSGLGATPRFPFVKAASVQVTYSDGSISQLEPFATSVTFVPPGAETISSVAVWDVDHNRSAFTAAGEHCGRYKRGITIQ